MMFMWMAPNNWRLGNLYFQALFYMFIFRHKQLLELEEGELYDLPNLNVLACNFTGTQTILSVFGLVQYPLCLFKFLKTTTELNSPNFSRTRLYRAKLSRPGKRVTLPAESTLARNVDLRAKSWQQRLRMLWLFPLDPVWRSSWPSWLQSVYMEKSWPYHRKRVTRLDGLPL